MPIPTLLAAPVKLLAPYHTITRPALEAIQSVVNREEGGWKINPLVGENDGGWTYGGMSANKFREYFPGTQRDDIIKLVADTNTVMYLQQTILSIYYQDYYLPALQKIPGNDSVNPALLSCIINCGPGGLDQTLFKQKKERISFPLAWAKHYVDIIINKPEMSKFMHAWLTRVFLYV